MSLVDYADTVEGLRTELLQGFFEGWAAPPSPEQHLALLEGSDHVVVAWAGPTVAGFVTAISDGVLAAYIPLLEVRPEYQGRGVGSELVRRILGHIGPLYMVDVVCDPDVQKFYERLGFQPATGASLRNYGWARTSP